MTVPNLCVPLTSYKEWKGTLMFADIKHLRPIIPSRRLDEFIQNAKLSPPAFVHIILAYLAGRKSRDPDLTASEYRKQREAGQQVHQHLPQQDQPVRYILYITTQPQQFMVPVYDDGSNVSQSTQRRPANAPSGQTQVTQGYDTRVSPANKIWSQPVRAASYHPTVYQPVQQPAIQESPVQ